MRFQSGAFSKGRRLATFIRLIPVVLAALWMWAIISPFPIKENDLEVSSRRTPEENITLVEQLCTSRGANFCPCLMKAIYMKTTRLERMLVIYNDGWVDRFALWRGARNLGLSNDDISRKRELAFATISSLKATCIANQK